MSLMERYRQAFLASPGAVTRWESGKAFVKRGQWLNGVKVVCAVPGCGRSGYDGIERPAPWQHACLLGHSPCPGGCGRVFPLRWDGTPQTHGHHRHTCPGPG